MSLDIVTFPGQGALPPPLMAYLRACAWSAGPYLARCLTEGMVLEPEDSVFFLMEEEHPAAFLTLSRQDCIDDPARFPWIGFVYVDPAFRGYRLSGRLIGHALAEARRQGFRQVWLATDEMGFYEKYGFVYRENCVDIFGQDSRIYSISLEETG